MKKRLGHNSSYFLKSRGEAGYNSFNFKSLHGIHVKKKEGSCCNCGLAGSNNHLITWKAQKDEKEAKGNTYGVSHTRRKGRELEVLYFLPSPDSVRVGSKL